MPVSVGSVLTPVFSHYAQAHTTASSDGPVALPDVNMSYEVRNHVAIHLNVQIEVTWCCLACNSA